MWVLINGHCSHCCYNGLLDACLRLKNLTLDSSSLAVQLALINLCVPPLLVDHTWGLHYWQKLPDPFFFWCNWYIDVKMNRRFQLSPEDTNTDRGFTLHTCCVDKQSVHHKGTIATVLLLTQQTRPFKMSKEKAVARVQCCIDSKWAHHLTTMNNLWTPTILDIKWWSKICGSFRNGWKVKTWVITGQYRRHKVK